MPSGCDGGSEGNMSVANQHKSPALHNAMWPGLVGKGGPGNEPAIDLETMLNLNTVHLTTLP